MEIKRSSSISPSIEQSSSAEKGTTSSTSKTTSTGISSNTKDGYVTDIAKNSGAMDPNTLVQTVLRESYLQTTEDLKSYAEKVKYFNESKKEVREHMEGLRGADANLKREFSNLQPGQKTNVFESMLAVLKEDVKEDNETKKYFMNRIETMNKVNEALSHYVEQLTDASRGLAAKEKDDDD